MGSVTLLQKKREPDQELIETLRELLAHAESGELVALAGIAEYHEDDPWYVTSGTADWWAMRGRLADLGEEITRDDDEDE